MTEALPTLRGERVVLRPGRGDDAAALEGILAEPEITRWWGVYPHERVLSDLLGPASGFVIEIDDEVGGWLSFAEETDPEYLHVVLDMFLATEHHGHGYAQEALALAIRHFVAQGHHRFTIDPAAENRRALRAYEAAGFRRVGIMRAYERGPNGEFHDNVLMELLAADL